ncbi:energy transducer TonB [Aquitalea sp. ASV15]|uniref:energy transducer TonB n=1 Tax=Aquitalea sp. ASV15 TaxID=2795104 RepID=UPI0018EDBD87|nr:energy transducer TonB [Aquitalea sp. ASV15]
MRKTKSLFIATVLMSIVGCASSSHSISELSNTSPSPSDKSTTPLMTLSSSSHTLPSIWIAKVIAKIRPLVIIPTGENIKYMAIARVKLLPNLEVSSVTLLHSSGNQDYDQSVLKAIFSVRTFPQLPDGENFKNYSEIIIHFKS